MFALLLPLSRHRFSDESVHIVREISSSRVAESAEARCIKFFAALVQRHKFRAFICTTARWHESDSSDDIRNCCENKMKNEMQLIYFATLCEIIFVFGTFYENRLFLFRPYCLFSQFAVRHSTATLFTLRKIVLAK